jgi:hypothetical protein
MSWIASHESNNAGVSKQYILGRQLSAHVFRIQASLDTYLDEEIPMLEGGYVKRGRMDERLEHGQ